MLENLHIDLASVPTAVQYSLTPSEVAAILKVKIRTLCLWRSKKIGPPYLKIEKKVWYSRPGLDEWLQSKIIRED